jgi:hypothetical protein
MITIADVLEANHGWTLEHTEAHLTRMDTYGRHR